MLNIGPPVRGLRYNKILLQEAPEIANDPLIVGHFVL